MAQLAPKSLTLSECERLELEKLLNRHSTPQQIALRAKIILLVEEGKNNRSYWTGIEHQQGDGSEMARSMVGVKRSLIASC